MDDTTDGAKGTIGWVRAIVTSVAILGLIVVFFAYVPNYALTHLSMGRHAKVAITTTISVVALILLAWLLRWLQRRRLI